MLEKNIEIRKEIGNATIKIFSGDILRIRQVLINLVGNAVTDCLLEGNTAGDRGGAIFADRMRVRLFGNTLSSCRKRAAAESGVGNPRRQASSRRPSGLTTRGPTTPTSWFSSRNFSDQSVKTSVVYHS